MKGRRARRAVLFFRAGGTSWAVRQAGTLRRLPGIGYTGVDRQGGPDVADEHKAAEVDAGGAAPPEATKRRRSLTRELWDWTKAIAIAVVLSVLVRTYVFAPTIVDGESMMTTLETHERVIVNKLIYRFEAPKRGDIIVFHATPDKDFIKRIVGLPGDRLEVRRDVLYVNGRPVDEPYLAENKALWKKELEEAHLPPDLPFTEDFTVDRVPPGTVFVLGDNRRNSTDSRVLGPVPLSRIVGRAEFVFWPPDRFRWLHP
ncbi:signal peptidase I [Hydrogenibacillus sp. N12]|nr:signal peptidase I [Hydrogenibacillus sp. N12]